MKITLNQIPKTGLSATEKKEPSLYDLDTEEATVVSPLELTYRIFREEENLLANISIRCTLRLLCSRCVTPYESPFHKEVEGLYPIGNVTVIDLTGEIREEILIEYPVKPLCREECKGICTVCGQNLNEAACPCAEEVKMKNEKGKIEI